MKAAPDLYFAGRPMRAAAMFPSASCRMASASPAASSPSTERPQTRHLMRVHRPAASFVPDTAPQQSPHRPLMSTARAGPG